MAERERSSHRPPGHASSGSTSNSGIFGFFNRKPPPREATPPLASLSSTSGSSNKAVMQRLSEVFSIESAIQVMDEERSTTRLCHVVNATSAYILNRQQDAKDPIPVQEIEALLFKAQTFSNDKSDTPLRMAALRLMAPLLTHTSGDDDRSRSLTDDESLYKLIVAGTTPWTSSIVAESVFVKTGCLRALTQDGRETHGMDGIVGWLVRSLETVRDEWIAWCQNGDQRSDDRQGDSVRTIRVDILIALGLDPATSSIPDRRNNRCHRSFAPHHIQSHLSVFPCRPLSYCPTDSRLDRSWHDRSRYTGRRAVDPFSRSQLPNLLVIVTVSFPGCVAPHISVGACTSTRYLSADAYD